MALLYRVVAFGEARGPWRGRKRQAEEDAVQTGWGEKDEEGQIYLDGMACIEWCRQDELRLSA